MGICFLIQPFDDGGMFDKRYKEVLKPAIEAAGLEAYRVDEDPTVSIPIEEIQRRIEDATVCLADISIDNPNVWFELGFAIARQKQAVMICSKNRTRFPFDVQHRKILTYVTDAPQDFLELGTKITERLKAILRKEEDLAQVMSSDDTAGLSRHEIVALVSVAENLGGPSGTVSAHDIRQDMERAGFTKVATFIALTRLVRKSLVSDEEEEDYNGNSYMVYRMTGDGVDWLVRNQDKLLLWQEPIPPANPFGPAPDDDIPF